MKDEAISIELPNSVVREVVVHRAGGQRATPSGKVIEAGEDRERA